MGTEITTPEILLNIQDLSYISLTTQGMTCLQKFFKVYVYILWHVDTLPFGLCNTPATFERLTEPNESCLVYLDDVIVTGRMFQEHLLNLRKVFQHFREAHLKLNAEKCIL
jgi:hypothetical protein